MNWDIDCRGRVCEFADLTLLEDLSFLGMPQMSGIDIIRKLDSDWEVFYNVRRAVRFWENNTIKKKKRR